MAKRKSMSKKTRFEVFKRDSFACQYCGRSAPNVILNADHIHPAGKDGANDILNLITSCMDCNAGKSDRLLSDDSVIRKQKAQLDELNKRREQLEMMLDWRNELKHLQDNHNAIAVQALNNILPGWTVQTSVERDVAKLVKKYGLNLVLQAIDTADLQYIELGKDDLATSESADNALAKLPGICRGLSLPEWKQGLYHARNIARSVSGGWWSDSTSREVLQMFQRAYEAGYTIDQLKSLAADGLSYSELAKTIDRWLVNAHGLHIDSGPEWDENWASGGDNASAIDLLQETGELPS